MKLIQGWGAAALALFAVSVASPAVATTDCTGTVSRIEADANAKSPATTVFFVSNGHFVLHGDNKGYPTLISLAETAMTTQVTITARFLQDGVDCSAPEKATLSKLIYGP